MDEDPVRVEDMSEAIPDMVAARPDLALVTVAFSEEKSFATDVLRVPIDPCRLFMEF